MNSSGQLVSSDDENCSELVCGNALCGNAICGGGDCGAAHYGQKSYTSGIVYNTSGSVKGLPSEYMGRALTWSSLGQLTSSDDVTYVYDGYGKRIKKGDIIYTYDLGGKLIKQSNGIEYIYDTSGLCGFKYDSVPYLYRKNAQGDITHIIDNNGKIVVKYIYDAWGNHTCVDSDETLITNPNHIGNLNPFRYRGYFYDVETKLYYLQTRYYDPITGRFISQDDVSYLDPESINGLNLYAYCGNNPVMGYDPNGTWDWGKFWKVVAGIAIIAALLVLTIVTAGAASPILSVGAAAVFGMAFTGAAVLGTVGAITGGAEGFLNGVIGGAVLGGSIGVAIAGFATGLGTSIGLMMATYGISTAMGMAEVAITQARKSDSEGLSLKKGMNNVLKAMVANAPNIAFGNLQRPGGSIFGTKILSKFPYLNGIKNKIVYGGNSYYSAFMAKPSPFSYLMSAFIVGYSTYSLGKAIFGNPDYDKWILF